MVTPAVPADVRQALVTATYEWLVRQTVRAMRRGQRKSAAGWCAVAGELTALFPSPTLADERLEDVLRSLATPRAGTAGHRGPPKRWLHVMSLAYRTGGHTALVRRWLEMAPGDERHDAALTYQPEADWPEAFVRGVQSRGGRVVSVAAAGAQLLARADALRVLSEEYDAVVLHVHPWDVIPAIAFGGPGGCPVLLMNHADHAFWFGSSIADAVVNIRPSGELLSRQQRGCRVHLRLPVPLPDSTFVPADGRQRSETRRSLGIRADAVVFLTVGSRFKYLPMGDFSFLDAAGRILERRPDAVVLVVGPAGQDDGWPALVGRFGAQLRVMGTQPDLTPYFAVSDIYLEGFPFGSLTALLEAVSAGLAPVLAPSLCPLPYRSDDFALDTLPIAADVDGYVELALTLAADVPAAREHAARLAEQVRAAHGAPGWLAWLSVVAKFVRDCGTHSVVPIAGARPLDDERVRYWAGFVDRSREDTAFGWAYRTAMRDGLRPKVDRAMLAALRSAGAQQGTSPLKPWALAFVSHLLAALPAKAASFLYERM